MSPETLTEVPKRPSRISAPIRAQAPHLLNATGADGTFRIARLGLVAMLIALALWFGLLDRPLWDPDEGRYAEIPREMVASGDWVTPRLNDLVYLEKPPLQYWATALAFELFGQRNATARLWPALTGFAGVLLLFYAGRRLHSTLAGIYAALMLCSGCLYFGAAHFNNLDMALSFFTEAVILAIALAFAPSATRAEHAFWIHGMWVAAGAAILTKGLVGVVLPASALVLYSVLFRDYTVCKRLSPISGTFIVLAIVIPWFVAVGRANPDFFHFFFVHEHLERYLTTQHHRYQPFWFFVPIFLVGALPWTLPMLNGLWDALRRAPAGTGFSWERFLAVWSVFVFVFFSASGSKLVGYIVPILPSLALLAGRYLCVVEPAALKRQFLPVLAVPVLLMGAVLYILAGDGVRNTTIGVAALTYIAPAACLLACGALYAMRSGFRARLFAVMSLAFSTMASTQALLAGAEIVSPHRTSWHIARQIIPHIRHGTRIYSVGIYPQSLPVYLNRTVTLVAFRGELDYGLGHEPHKGIPTLAAFRQAWLLNRDAVAVMEGTTYATLRSEGFPMVLIAQDAGFIVVRRE